MTKRRLLLSEEVVLTTLVYLILGVALIPLGILYAGGAAAGFDDKWILLLFLGLSVPYGRFLRPRIERLLLRRFFGLQRANLAAAGESIVVATPATAARLSLAGAVFLSIVFQTGGGFRLEIPPKYSAVASSGLYVRAAF